MPGRAEAGFSLIEVLVAMVILAIGLAAGFKLQILDLGLVRSDRASTRATLAAESLLWRITVSPPVPGQVEEGEMDGFNYRIVAKSDQSRPGLDQVELLLRQTDSTAPAQTFRRLVVEAAQDQKGQGKQGQDGKSGSSGDKTK
jgi:prepilin-type N-terminal cleavage/methylation domain-containing protein